MRGWNALPALFRKPPFFRAKGFLVFKLDNRGSSRRGLKFEGAIQHKMGGIEIEDQVLGVKWLVKNNLADPNRVGMYGWSYGGYMSAMALAKAPDVFKVAVAFYAFDASHAF